MFPWGLMGRTTDGALRARDREVFTEDDLVRIRVCFAQFISSLAKKSSLRQRVAATASVYFKRFYMKNCYRDHDPRLLAPAALYLAAKTEEHTVQAKALISQANAMYRADHSYPYGIRDLHDYEFRIINELQFNLIVFHPYRPLTQLCNEIEGMSDCLQTAWAILNDSYRTDACLLFPPFVIAISCLFMAASVLGKKPETWIHNINVEVGDVISAVQMISPLYAPANVQNSGPRFMEKLHRKLHDHFGSKPKGAAVGEPNPGTSLGSAPPPRRPPTAAIPDANSSIERQSSGDSRLQDPTADLAALTVAPGTGGQSQVEYGSNN